MLCKDLEDHLTIDADGRLEGSALSHACALYEQFGCLVVRGVFDRDLLLQVRDQFMSHVDLEERDGFVEGALSVGDRRHMVTVPIEGVANDPAIYSPPALEGILANALNRDWHLNSLVAVVSLPGAEMQHIHFDHPWLFPDHLIQTPTYAVTVVVPLIDITPELGPTRLWPASHAARKNDPRPIPDALPYIEPCAQLGDAVLFDYHLLHAGLANTSDQPRPMFYNCYGRSWWRDAVNYDGQPRLILPEAERKRVPRKHRKRFLP